MLYGCGHARGSFDLPGAPRDRTAPKEAPRNVKNKATYRQLADALQYKWTRLTKRQTKEVNPALFFSILGTIISFSRPRWSLILPGLWQYEFSHRELPIDATSAAEIQLIVNSLISTADVNKQVLREVPLDLIE